MARARAGFRPGLALLAGLSGCGLIRPAAPPAPLLPGHVRPAPSAAIPADANFVLAVSEAIASLEEDTASYTKIFIDGQPAGETAVGPRSQERRWGRRLEAGNHLFRFEYQVLPSTGDWTALDAQWQPTERFIRIEGGARTSAALKFYEGARRHDLRVSREPAAKP